MSWSRLSASPKPGRVPRKMRRLAIVSATAFAPFMCVKAFKTSWVRFANSRSDCSRSRIVTAGCDVRTTTERLSFAVLSDDEMMSRWTCISCACATSASGFDLKLPFASFWAAVIFCNRFL